MHHFIQLFTDKIISFLNNTLNIKLSLATTLGEFFMLLVLFIVSFIAYKITIKIIRSAVIPLLQRTQNQFDDLLLKHHFFRNISFLVPAMLLFYFTEDTIENIPLLVNTIRSILEVVFVLIFILSTNSILDTINDYYNRYDFAKDHR